MCNPVIAVMAVSAVLAAKNANDTARVNRATAQNNQVIAGVQADDALRRGELNSQDAQRKAAITGGAQRAGFAARGLDLNAGTPANLLEQTNFFGQVDSNTARFNAKKEAWGYQNNASAFGAQAANSNPGAATASSLIGSAGAVAGKWYGMAGTSASAGGQAFTGSNDFAGVNGTNATSKFLQSGSSGD